MAGPTYRDVVHLAYLWIIVTENGLFKADYCPCIINIILQSADCSWRNLDDIPRCVPSTTKRLDLSNNDIVYQPRQFQRFTSLTYLDLSHNMFFRSGNDSFEKLTHLQVLFLNDTSLRHIPNNFFAELSNLKILSLQQSLLKIFPADFFVYLNKLTHLDLSDNAFTVFDTSNCQFSSHVSLQYLNLGKNPTLILNEHSFSGLVNLEGLDLSNCRLESLSLGIFSQLHRLTYLNLSGNNIFEINNITFLNLSNLSHLDLSFNIKNLILNTHSFTGLLNLNFLSLKSTKIRNLPSLTQELFQPLAQLKELHVEGVCTPQDTKKACDKIDEILGSVPSLKRLYLDNFLLNSLGKGFQFMQALDELNFVNGHECIITVLSGMSFYNLRNLPLSKIRIEMCEIKNIEARTFSYFRNLSVLELNSVTSEIWCNESPFSIDIETGLEYTNIKHFRFQPQCQHQHFTIGRLKGLDQTPLEELEISNSSTKRFHFYFYRSFPISIKSMFLQNNYIDSIPNLSLQNLQILNLSNQKEFSAQRKNISAKATIPEVSSYSQTSLSIPKILLKNNKSIYHYQDNQLKTLHAIDISHSRLLCDAVKILFHVTDSLVALNIAYQRSLHCFESIWKVTKRLLKLEKFIANGNHIKYIPFDAFSQVRNLKILSLRHNSLPVVSFDLKTLVLKELDVSYNSIMYLSNEMTKILSKIAQQSNLNINLYGNSLICDCERIEFVAWLRYTKSIYQKDKLTCNVRKTNYDISNIDSLYETFKYECTAQEVVRNCITGFVVLNLVSGIVAVIWYRRWKIRYLLAIGRKNVNPYHPIEECVVELEYDVYISYDRDYDVTNNETLHEMVTQKLYPGLQRRGFEVFIREEIDPGMGLYNGISRSLRRSRKVLCLITKNYCKDHWNVFEFNTAIMEGIFTKRQVIIPVALESLGREDLHAEVYAYLSSEPVSYYSCNVTEATLLSFLTEKIRDNRNFD